MSEQQPGESSGADDSFAQFNASYGAFVGRASETGSRAGMLACEAGRVSAVDEAAIADAPVWPAPALLDGMERRLAEIDQQFPTYVDRAALLGTEFGGTVIMNGMGTQK
jgi:hypothetical protein